MPTRNASATWEGGIMKGKGSFRGESGAIEAPYSFSTRFEEGVKGTNPEELIAAAHAACFSMALSGQLERNGATPTRIETKAACTVEKSGDGFAISGIRLTTRVRATGIDAAKFQEVARGAKEGCPVSKALSAVKIELDAQLE
jgi:lipoyl-dependent peroxiredoxin